MVEDCGTIVNPLIVAGQVSGAIARAGGAVLYEGLPYDDDGQFRDATLGDFLFPNTTDLPSVEVDHLETPSPVTEGGFEGMGEGGLIGDRPPWSTPSPTRSCPSVRVSRGRRYGPAASSS